MKYLKEYIDWEEDWEEEDPDEYKDYPEDFKNFLIENDALEKFNLNITNKPSYNLTMKKYFMRMTRVDWINNAFDWGLSPENYKYWKKLHYMWK